MAQTIVPLANIKGPRGNGIDEPRQVGDDIVVRETINGIPKTTVVGNFRGKQGAKGLDGAGGLITDEAVAGNMDNPASQTYAKTAANFATRVQAGGINNLDQFPGSNDSARLQAANDAIVASGAEATITVSRPLTLPAMVSIDVGYVSLRFTAGPVESQVLTGPTLLLHNSRSLASAVANGVANNRKSIVGLKLHGPGRKTSGFTPGDAANSVGIRFHSEVGNVRGMGFYDFELRSFDVGLQFQRNAYLLSFKNWHIYDYNIGVHMPGGHANYGENLRFEQGTFGTGGTAVLNDNPDGAFHIDQTSVDFCQKVAQVDRGHVFMSQCHVELNSTSNPLPNAPIVTTGNSRSSFVFSSGRFMLHAQSTQAAALFYSGNAFWGGGIFFSDAVEMFHVGSGSPVLCTGPGRFRRDEQVFDGNGSGQSGGSVVSSRALNRLSDGLFTGATVLDAYLTRAEATSRTQSTAATLEQTDASFVVRKLTAGLAEFAFDVPVRSSSSRYGFLMTLTQTTATSGSFAVTEQFVRLGAPDSRGIPALIGAPAQRAASTINFAGLTTPNTITYRQGDWNRFAPPWATHFRVYFNLSSMPAGTFFRLSEMVITGE